MCRQGEFLSPFIFSRHLNDIENEFVIKGVNVLGMLKSYLLLYADDRLICSCTGDGLQGGLNIYLNIVPDGN